MKRLCYAGLLATAMVFALAPTSAFAAGPCPPFVCTHGNSDNECTGDHCKKTNPAGNNCSAQGNGLCK
jgi:hypothetical protein